MKEDRRQWQDRKFAHEKKLALQATVARTAGEGVNAIDIDQVRKELAQIRDQDIKLRGQGKEMLKNFSNAES